MTENKVLEETICQFWGLVFPNSGSFFLRNKIFQALFDNILFIIYKIFRHFILLLANRNVTKSTKLWTEVWIFLHTSVTKKNKILYKKYENFSQKKTKSYKSYWIWIYFGVMFTILEVWRDVILLLKKILWGLLFGNLMPCMAAYGTTPRLLEIFTYFILKRKNSPKHCM